MMKKMEIIAESQNFTAVNIGSLDELTGYSLIHPKTGQEIVGKAFVKDITKSTGTEISFTTLPPKSDLGYFHIHNKNEETYIILKGYGEFQVDDNCFPIKEGSVIRVAPVGKRCMRNSSDVPMVYIVIQAKENSLEEYTTEDGKRVDCIVQWL